MVNKKVTVCFVANFSKTYFFHEIAKLLVDKGVKVCWIVTKLHQYNFLKKNYGAENVLYINRTFIKKTNAPVDDFRLNELVYGDRVFMHNKEDGLQFLTNIQKPIYDFFKAHAVRFAFGELTWSHEVLIRRICEKRKELNAVHTESSLVRIPNLRFAFFLDESQHDMFEFNEPVEVKEALQAEKPSYLKINDKILAKNSSVIGRLNRAKRFFTGENIEKNDPNVIIDTALRARVMSSEEINKIAYRRIKTTDFKEVENDNFVFIGLHKQPEVSIDVNGRYYDDQAANIINLWRMLPQGWKLLVKEHTNAIGDRPPAFYKKLQSYPGIVIIKETTDSKIVVAKSRLVATVTGTMGYEAALMKIPAITFARVFFNRLNYCRYVTLDDLVNCGDLARLAEEIKAMPDNRLEYTRYLMSNTFKGYITDPLTDASVLDPENLENVCQAYLKLIEKHG